MDRTAIQQLLSEVTTDLDVLAAKYRELEGVQQYLRAKLAEHPSGQEEPGDETDETEPEPVRSAVRPIARHRSLAGMTQLDAAAAVLGNANGALSTATIAKAMTNSGFVATSFKRLRKSLYTGMTRDPARFRRVGAGLWALVPSHAESNGSR